MNPAPQVVQQVQPVWFDWITIAAIVLGPVLALFAQRALDWLREKKNRRVQLYMTVMSLRASWLHHDSIRALNSIDTVFDKRSDQSIRDAWTAVINHSYSQRAEGEEAAREWNQRMNDLRADLYQRMGDAVGYHHTLDYIKSRIYYPQYHVDVELEQMQIRKQFAKAITDDGLKVIITEPRQ